MSKNSLICLVMGLALTACDGNKGETNGTDQGRTQQETSTTTSQNQTLAPDQIFIDGMVPHHEMAVMMADDALAKAGQSKTKDFARLIKQKQPPEIQQLKSWRQQWYGSSTTPPMDHSDFQALSTGPDYDRKWTEMMIAHHQMAVDMSQQLLTTATKPEIKQMAQQVIADQSREIEQLQTYLKTLS